MGLIKTTFSRKHQHLSTGSRHRASLATYFASGQGVWVIGERGVANNAFTNRRSTAATRLSQSLCDHEIETLEKSVKYYWNAFTMVLGSIGYVTVAGFPQYSILFFPLLALYAYGITIGFLVCVLQFFYGLWHYFLKGKKEEAYLKHMKSLGIWFIGFLIFFVGVMNGLIITV